MYNVVVVAAVVVAVVATAADFKEEVCLAKVVSKERLHLKWQCDGFFLAHKMHSSHLQPTKGLFLQL